MTWFSVDAASGIKALLRTSIRGASAEDVWPRICSAVTKKHLNHTHTFQEPDRPLSSCEFIENSDDQKSIPICIEEFPSDHARVNPPQADGRLPPEKTLPHIGPGFKSRRTVFEGLRQPAAKEARVEVVFLTEVRDLNLFDQVPAQDGDLTSGS